MFIRGFCTVTTGYGFIACALALIGTTASGTAATRRPIVVTSFLPLYCWTANVAGDTATVENLLPARAEPHEYAFTPGDARRLNEADRVVINGLGLEAWLPKWLRNEPQHVRDKLVDISGGIQTPWIRTATLRTNPHIWLDPQIACMGVSNIAAALVGIDPPHAAVYRSNALAYVQRLQALDEEIRNGLSGITNRAIVTYHDAFPYFARRFSLEIVGVVEEVPEVNPTPKYLARLSQTMRTRGIRAIFIPPNSASRLARQIAQDLHVQLVELDTLEAGALTPDAYEKRMRVNLGLLRQTLR